MESPADVGPARRWARRLAGALVATGCAGAPLLAVIVVDPAFVDSPAAAVPVGLAVVAVAAAGRWLLPPRLRVVAATVVLAASLALAFVLLARRVTPTPPASAGGRGALPHPVVVLGVDGATWSIADPLLAAGELPNLAWLISRGARAELESLEPMSSPRLWASIDTGVRPHRHGILSFWSTQSELRVARVWERLAARREARVGLFEWYHTWPPPESATWSVPGVLAPDATTRPAGLAFVKELAGLGRIEGRPSLGRLAGLGLDALANGMRLTTALAAVDAAARTGGAGRDERYVREHLVWARLKSDVFASLVKRSRPDFAALFLNETDVFAHRYWPGSAAADGPSTSRALAEGYRVADRALGLLREATAGRDPFWVVVSDHGFRGIDADRRGIPAPRLDAGALLEITGLGGEPGLTLTELDGGLLVEARGESSAVVLRRAVEILEAVELDGGGLLELRPAEDGQGVMARLAAGVEIGPSSTVVAGGRIAPAALVVRSLPWTGRHDPAGVLVLAGPGVRRGVELPRASLLDVAPTLLALCDEPIPAGLDGVPLVAAFDGAWLAAHPVRFGPPVELVERRPDAPVDGEAVRERLRALGYL